MEKSARSAYVPAAIAVQINFSRFQSVEQNCTSIPSSFRRRRWNGVNRSSSEPALEQRNVSITTVSEQDQDKSPLDVGHVETSITREQIVSAIREGHERV